MNALLTVLTTMIEILKKQQQMILELQREVKLDNETELTDADFADLSAQLASVVPPSNIPLM